MTNITFNGKPLDLVTLCALGCEPVVAWEDTAEYAALLAWVSDPVNRNDPEYSDIYKDVFGVRP